MEEKSTPANSAAGADKTTEPAKAGFIYDNDKFAVWNHLILRDLNKNPEKATFYKYSKDKVAEFLRDPERNAKGLREAVVYLYGASPHFRRLIQYFVGLSDLSYIVEPSSSIDPRYANVKTVGLNYRKTLKMLSSMNIKSQIPKVLTVCLREDVMYGTLWVTSDSITIQQLPSDYCEIASIEGNVFNVNFDFSYFNGKRNEYLDYYPAEFRRRYEAYYADKRHLRWQELDSPNSFAIKCNIDIPNYPLPPFAGVLREIYELEDYKDLKLSKTALENYAMLVMVLPMLDDGRWKLDFDKAKEFWMNLDAIMPEEVGTILSPMDIKKISFEKTNTKDTDTIAEAGQNLFSAAGVSSLLFNNERASGSALLLSIKADQAITYGIVKSVGDVINRFLQAQKYGKFFRINFLDVSPFNRKEAGDAYLKAATYGLPTISAYAASQGIGQGELDTMSFLEGRVLNLPELFRPIRSSTQMSGDELDSGAATDEGGAPTKDIDELSDSGEQTREDM